MFIVKETDALYAKLPNGAKCLGFDLKHVRIQRETGDQDPPPTMENHT